MPSDRLASGRRSLIDAHTGPFCCWTGDPPRTPRRTRGAGSIFKRLDSVLAIDRTRVDAGPARTRVRFNHRLSCTCHRVKGLRLPRNSVRRVGPSIVTKASRLSRDGSGGAVHAARRPASPGGRKPKMP
jgi:hypothetical protein